MKIVTADITGSLIVNGVDVTNNVVSSSVFSGSIAGRVTNLEQFSASLDATFATDASVTASILVLSQSVQASQAALSSSYALTSGSYVAVSASYLATSASYLTTSASYAAASGSLSVRVTNTEATASTNTQASASFAAQSASLSTRLTTDETNITTLTNASASFAAQSASLSTRLTTDETNITTLTNASASFAAQSASLSTRLTTDESNYTNLSSSFVAESGSISGRVTTIESKYATTGSNTFTNLQYINATTNAQGFTTTASLYTDGGLRVSKDSYVSGTAYFNNVVVYGTSSIQYLTSSQVNVGANIINLNTQTPAVRFGGMAVADSGSNAGVTGSMLWDSVNNRWVYSNPSGSTYDGGMIISGPRNTTGLGNEVGTTACYIMAGQGGDHITSSAIYTDTNATCFYGNSFVSSSGAASFPTKLSVGTSSISYPLTINANSTQTSIALMSGYSDAATRNWGIATNALAYGDFNLAQSSTLGGDPFSGTSRMYFSAAGTVCFSCQVCAPAFVGGTACFTSTVTAGSDVVLSAANPFIYGGTAAGGVGVSNIGGQTYLKIFGASHATTPNVTTFVNAGSTTLTINASGESCFANNICAPNIVTGFTGNLYIYRLGSTNYASFKSDGSGNIIFTNGTGGTPTARYVTTADGITCFTCQVYSPNHIATSTCSTANLRVYGSSGAHQWDMYLNGNNIRFSDNTSGAGCFVVDTTATFGGYVGIGTSPITKLQLYDSSPNYIVLTNTGADGVSNAIQGGIIGQARGYSNNLAQMANILFRNKNTAAWYKGEIAFSTNDSDGTNPAVSPVERMRISSEGNVGIGTPSPIAALQICSSDGQLRLSGDGRAQMILGTSAKTWQFETSCGVGNVSACSIGIVEAGSGTRFQIYPGGVACFQNTVCSPRFIGSSILTFTGLPTGTQSVACQSIESLWSLASSRCCASKGAQYGNGTWYVQGSTTAGNWIYYKFMVHNPVWFRAYIYLVNYADTALRKGCLQYSLDNSATWIDLANATNWQFNGTLDGSISLSGDSKLITLRWDSGGSSSLVGWNNVEFTACGSAFYSVNGLG